MKNAVKSLIKNSVGKPYFEIKEVDDELIFHLKKAVPCSKHFLMIKSKKNGKAIVKEIIKFI